MFALPPVLSSKFVVPVEVEREMSPPTRYSQCRFRYEPWTALDFVLSQEEKPVHICRSELGGSEPLTFSYIVEKN